MSDAEATSTAATALVPQRTVMCGRHIGEPESEIVAVEFFVCFMKDTTENRVYLSILPIKVPKSDTRNSLLLLKQRLKRVTHVSSCLFLKHEVNNILRQTCRRASFVKLQRRRKAQ